MQPTKRPPGNREAFRERSSQRASAPSATRANVANKNYILPFMSAGFMSFAAVSSICDVLFIDVA